MSKLILGIHHVTALADAPQRNVDFYAGLLGLRLVKKTVNFDAPEIYHLYYGNDQGEPGTIMTFFPYPGIRRGRPGSGMVAATSFSVPAASIEFWERRLQRFGVAFRLPQERFGRESCLEFEDPDGLKLELTFTDRDPRPGTAAADIPPEHAIRGFHGVEIWAENLEGTAALLTEKMDHSLLREEGNRFRFAAEDVPGSYVDLVAHPGGPRGLGGGGTVHHLAFATADTATQAAARAKVADRNPTPVIDRQYFKSVYFREPGGVLFEIATLPPGFAVDEAPEALGTALKLPPQYEAYRDQIEQILPPVSPKNEQT